MPNLHPLLVHFPIALLTVGLAFDLIGLLLRREEFSRTGWWTQLAGTLGVISAVTTGLLAEKSVVIPAAARGSFESHEQIGFVVISVFAALLLWRIASRTHIPERHRMAFLALFLGGLILIWVGAWYGGEMVYRFGVGIQQ